LTALKLIQDRIDKSLLEKHNCRIFKAIFMDY